MIRPRGAAAVEALKAKSGGGKSEPGGEQEGSERSKKDKTRNSKRKVEEVVFEDGDEGATGGEDQDPSGEREEEKAGDEGRTAAKKAKDRDPAEDDDEEAEQDQEDSDDDEKGDSDPSPTPVHDAHSDQALITGADGNDAAEVSVEAQQVRRLPVLTKGNYTPERVKKLLKAVPGLACSTCTIGPECPEFKEGYVCAFRAAFSAFDMRDADGVLAAMGHVVQTNMERWQFAAMEERIVSGGHPDPNVTALSETVIRQGKLMVDLDREVSSVKVTVRGTGRAAAPVAAAAGAQAGKSIIETLFAPPQQVHQVIGTGEERVGSQALAGPQGSLITVDLHPDPQAAGAERSADMRGAEEEKAQGGRDEGGQVPQEATFAAQDQPQEG